MGRASADIHHIFGKKTGRDEVLDYIDSINISLKKAKSQETPL